jgi:hypothetical protein
MSSSQTPTEIILPATRDGVATTLKVTFVCDDPEALVQGWSAMFVDLEHPDGEIRVWTNYFGFRENIFDNAILAQRFYYGTGRGIYEMELADVKQARRLAIRLGVLEGYSTQVPLGPRARVSPLAAE